MVPTIFNTPACAKHDSGQVNHRGVCLSDVKTARHAVSSLACMRAQFSIVSCWHDPLMRSGFFSPTLPPYIKTTKSIRNQASPRSKSKEPTSQSLQYRYGVPTGLQVIDTFQELNFTKLSLQSFSCVSHRERYLSHRSDGSLQCSALQSGQGEFTPSRTSSVGRRLFSLLLLHFVISVPLMQQQNAARAVQHKLPRTDPGARRSTDC